MRLFLCLVSLCWALSYCFPTRNSELDTKWELFKYTYEKNYTEKEDSFRRNVWEENLKFINEQNLLHKEGKLTYYLGMNAYGDMISTGEEFKKMLNPSISLRERRDTAAQFFSTYSDIPRSLDWREHGFVTPVADQGDCNSCWAYSVTGALEGQFFRKTVRLVQLSTQQLLDCSGAGNCTGGYILETYRYIIQNGDITTESCYPYMEKVNEETLCIDILESGLANFAKTGESFGVTWGDRGYMYLAKDRNNHCGIATQATYPIL
ncbi:cathepsin L2-like [Vombatus ursinus]|uniref:cathepsin L2-like n=1 Tax=Vombatus ursinus TaxID=29139 RepID=UPI000FFD28B7|nr:cathepsin L2-like [Vombatus ursinus]